LMAGLECLRILRGAHWGILRATFACGGSNPNALPNWPLQLAGARQVGNTSIYAPTLTPNHRRPAVRL
jgi:hypothetical protein